VDDVSYDQPHAFCDDRRANRRHTATPDDPNPPPHNSNPWIPQTLTPPKVHQLHDARLGHQYCQRAQTPDKDELIVIVMQGRFGLGLGFAMKREGCEC